MISIIPLISKAVDSYAYKRREDLKLSDKEIFDTGSSMHLNFIMGIIPIVSMIIALLNIGGTIISFSLAGFAYWLYPIVIPIYSKKGKRRELELSTLKKLLKTPQKPNFVHINLLIIQQRLLRLPEPMESQLVYLLCD